MPSKNAPDRPNSPDCSKCGALLVLGENWQPYTYQRCIPCKRAMAQKPKRTHCKQCETELIPGDTWAEGFGSLCRSCKRDRDKSLRPGWSKKTMPTDKNTTYHQAWWDKKSPEYQIWFNARTRAKKQGIPFTITVADIVIPEQCPICLIPFVFGRKGGQPVDGSPSLDKIIPSLGYVPGNVAVISHRANRLKQDATAAEIERLHAYMQNHLGEQVSAKLS